MKKLHKTIGADNLIDFDNRMNGFLVKLGHFKIVNIQYIETNIKSDANRLYIAFIIYQI